MPPLLCGSLPYQGILWRSEATIKKGPEALFRDTWRRWTCRCHIGLSSAGSPEVQTRLARDDDGKPISALQGIAHAVKSTWKVGGGPKVTIVSSGPMTNIGVFIAAHPELLEGVEQFVFMGGGNSFGNITPATGERPADAAWYF